MSTSDERTVRYRDDPRSTDELLSLALDNEPDRDNNEYWYPVAALQHRLPEILERVVELGNRSDAMKLTIPELSLVVMVGVSGSGKSTFARKHFKPTEILSSDACRGLVSDDENCQAATKDAFYVLHFIARKRLAAGKLTVVDATNVQAEARKPLIQLAREFHCLPVAIVLDLPERIAHERNKTRADRSFGPHVIRQQATQLHQSLRGLEREGFRHRFVLRSLEEVESAVIERQPLWNNRKTERGPFDIIGDVHGCFDELFELLLKLGYETGKSEGAWYHPLGRKLVFVGDLVDRGPKVPEVVRLVMDSVKLGSALCVPGNHDIKFMRKVWGKDVQITHGLAESLAQFGAYEEYYRGSAVVVYGHTPVPEPEWLNRTINIDTGCVFGGELTALRYPEQELVSVPAGQTYAEPRKPFLAPENQAPSLTAQQQHDDLLDLSDVIGKRIVATRLHGNVTIREENATAALEVMSRFAANPKWLIYLPPTMSPCSTSRQPGLLEHPAEAFDYYRHEGVPRVVCEEKHMGSRAVVVVCRDEDSAQKRFGVMGEGFGVCYTRTGRRFFDDTAVESTFLARVRDAVNRAGFWEEFKTDWLCLDCELMPWSAKAQGLLKDQYAPVGAAAGAMLEDAVGLLRQSGQRGLDVEELLIRTGERKVMASAYVDSYRRYCWPFHSVDDLKLAPFHLLATEGKVHVDKPNTWHMEHSRGYPVESLSPRRSTWSMLPILRARRTRFDGGRNSPPVEARAWLRSRSNSSLVADEG